MISVMTRAYGANGIEIYAGRDTYAEDPGITIPSSIAAAAASNAVDNWTTIDHWQLEITQLDVLTARGAEFREPIYAVASGNSTEIRTINL